MCVLRSGGSRSKTLDMFVCLFVLFLCIVFSVFLLCPCLLNFILCYVIYLSVFIFSFFFFLSCFSLSFLRSLLHVIPLFRYVCLNCFLQLVLLLYSPFASGSGSLRLQPQRLSPWLAGARDAGAPDMPRGSSWAPGLHLPP